MKKDKKDQKRKVEVTNENTHKNLHKKDDFAEASKNLAENNFIGLSK